jgi:hypothetical protein
MTVAASRDNGETFGPRMRIAEDNWKLEGCPDSGIALARTANRVYAAWLTEAAPAVNGVRFTWSDNAGKTWAPAVLASQKILDANYPSLSAAADGRVELAFQGRNPEKNKGWAASSAFVVEIAPDGGLSAPVEVPGIRPLSRGRRSLPRAAGASSPPGPAPRMRSPQCICHAPDTCKRSRKLLIAALRKSFRRKPYESP